MVLIVSGDAAQNSWIQFEVGAAVGMGKRVIPIALEGVLDADRLDYLLRDLKWIDASHLTPEEVASRVDDEVQR